MQLVNYIQNSALETMPFNFGLVLFSQGCNLSCEMCKGYNYEHVINEDNIIGDALTLIKNKSNPLDDCVVFLGGEPTIHHKKLSEAMQLCKTLNLKTKLFTNGILDNEIKELISTGLCNAVSLDYKGTKNIREKIGIDITDVQYNNKIKKLIRFINSKKVYIEVRLTLTTLTDIVEVEEIKHFCNLYNTKLIIQKDFRRNIVETIHS